MPRGLPPVGATVEVRLRGEKHWRAGTVSRVGEWPALGRRYFAVKVDGDGEISIPEGNARWRWPKVAR